MKELKEYRNFISLGVIFLICVVAAVHASHDDDAKLLEFSVNAANQVLAALLTVTTISATHERRKTDEVQPPAAQQAEALPPEVK